jgi:hypothetical protein
MNSRAYRRLTGALAALWFLACGPALAQVAPPAGGEILPDGSPPQFSLPSVEDFMASLIADDIQLRARVIQLEQLQERAEELVEGQKKEVERLTRLCLPRPIAEEPS